MDVKRCYLYVAEWGRGMVLYDRRLLIPLIQSQKLENNAWVGRDDDLDKIGQLVVRPMLCTKSHKAPEWGADKTLLFSFIIDPHGLLIYYRLPNHHLADVT